MVNKNDWRLNGQEEYLFGETLYFRKWDMSNINSHEHCIFCWEKISSILNTLHEGYVTSTNRYWICPKCFDDFKDSFQWHLQIQ